MIWKKGSKLKVGDVIGVWWTPGRDQIVALRIHQEPYPGWYQTLHGTPPKPGEVRLADFALNKVGMTIFPRDTFEVVDGS